MDRHCIQNALNVKIKFVSERRKDLTMTEQEKYLEVFRQYETAVRAFGYESAKDYEDSVSDINIQDKLRICRVIRNYLAHGQDSGKFICISPTMQKFMEDTVYMLDEGTCPVSKKMIPVAKCLHETNTVEEALEFMKKNCASAVPIFSKANEIIGVLTYENFARSFLKNRITKATKLSSYATLLPKNEKDKCCILIEKDTPVKAIFSSYQDSPTTIFVVADKDKPCGIYTNNKK